MRIGDLVKNIEEPACQNWVGLILAFDYDGEPIVYWSPEFPYEEEYRHDLRVVEKDCHENM